MCSRYFCFFLCFFSLILQAQDQNFCNWSYAVTANNAVIAVQQENLEDLELSGIDMNSSIEYIECPMWIGVFYQTFEGGPLECAGFSAFDNSQSMAIAAWGDDPTTNQQDGFLDGDEYIFGLCVDGVGAFYGSAEMELEPPFTDSYSTNGFASINSVVFGPPTNCLSCIIESCWPIDILEENKNKILVKTLDIYGREISPVHENGIVFKIYNDQTVSKTYQF